jgi:quercetin dioxygenase-like cupin family protein
MRRLSLLLSVVGLLLVGGVALGTHSRAVAQEATPAGDAMEPEGVAFELVTIAFGAEVASPADLIVARFTIEPGMGFPIEESDPTTGILLVESGTFTVQVEGAMSVTRGATLGEAIAAAEASGDFTGLTEAPTEGEAITLEAGDAAYIPANVNGEIRNDGDEPAIGIGFLIAPPEDMMAEATPAP